MFSAGAAVQPGRESSMDLDMRARFYALELLTTQLISEYLRTVPDPAAQTKWASEHLPGMTDALAVETETLDEEARLRVSIKENVTRILDTALARAKSIPLVRPSYDTGPKAGD
jgi:hypothetical protein